MIDKQHDFHVSRAELELFLRSDLLPGALTTQIEKLQWTDAGKAVIEIAADDATILREYLIDRMTVYGFDENYEPNSEGKIIEGLIDRLWLICNAR